MLEAFLLGAGTVLRLERDAWSMVKLLRQATNEYPPPFPTTRTESLAPYAPFHSSDEADGTSSPPDLLQSKLEEAMRTDVAVTTDLRLVVRGSMEALRSVLGDAGWNEAVETLEPVVFSQLGRMVA